MGLEKFFSPQSVAVIGASRTKGKVGHDVLNNLLQGGFEGKIFPVNPKAEDILGLKCFPDMNSLPSAPDLAIIALPAKAVPQAIASCGAKGTRCATVISAGFKETGKEGAELERKLVSRAVTYGVRVLGPNCLGIANTASKLNASFGPMPLPGETALLSQSGALITGILDLAKSQGIGFSTVVSIGNKADIDEEEIIRSLLQDPNTKVIAGYLENIVNGEKFMRTAGEVVPEKPILIVKAGSTGAGARAASSHTGSLAGTEAAYRCAFRRCGIVRAQSIQHLFDMAHLFAEQPAPQGNRFAVITNAGGPGIMAADACESMGLNFAKLSGQTEKELAEFLPPAANIHNPVDILGDSRADRYAKSLEILLQDRGVDTVLVLLTPQAMTDPAETAQRVAEVAQKSEKQVLACFIGSEETREGARILRENKIPLYSEPRQAVASVKATCDYVSWCNKPPRAVRHFPVNRAKTEKTIRRHRRLGLSLIGEQDAKDVLQAYGVNTPAGDMVHTAEGAVRVANRIGYPVAMKIASPDVSHKSDIGGVKLGLRNTEEVEDAFELMMIRVKRHAPQARIEGVAVQERALSLISIAHPKFRNQLLKEAKKYCYIRKEQGEITVGTEAAEGLEHPAVLDDGTEVLFRPIKPTDDRPLRNMLYSLSPESIYYRFFQPLKEFSFSYRQKLVNINFRDELAIVGCVASPGGEEIIAVGRYIREPGTSAAEVAFLVQDEWQNKGMGRHMLEFLARVAKQHGIHALHAGVLKDNKPMLNIFQTSGYEVYTKLEEDMYSVNMKLDR